ncbi:MAG: BatD family protein [Prevotellaceae bacterium]|nr:BatD family protein [Prevotellaceae bacterium]
MKQLLLLIIALLGSSFAAQVSAQSSVTVEARIDSLQILIGDQANIDLRVSLDAGKRAIFPAYRDTLVQGVDIVDIAQPDTAYMDNRKRMEITQRYTITAFDGGLYYLPPMEVLVDSVAYRSQSLALKVYEIEVDTAHVDRFFGPKDVMKPPFVWEDWYGVLTCLGLHIPFSFLFLYLIKRMMDNKPIIRKVKVTPKVPPHKQAMKEIERIKSEKLAQKAEAKEYYTDLTDTLRTYIKERFGFNALEMTSSEIIEQLLRLKDEAAIADLKELFLTADLVKFAKHHPMLNENDANLLNAIDFINETKEQIDENAKPQPTEITIIEKRPLRTKILLGAGIAIVGCGLLASLIYISMNLYNYFA